MFGREMYCPNCGTVDIAKTITRGSFAMEVLLWLFFLVPGVLYSIWRLTTRYEGCRECGFAALIPADSPRARAEMAATKR